VLPSDRVGDDLVDAILEGSPIDWTAAESSSEPAVRPLLRQLKVVAAVAAFARSDDARAAPVLWGHLQLLERIGRGTFGEVYRAWDTRLDREVALKLLPADSSAGDRTASAIIHEGRLLARVRHPNVVTIYGAEQISNQIGLWMEFVRGDTLEHVLQQRTISAAEAIGIGLELSHAISAVHGAGLLHRDIKTHNVVRAEDGRIVLMDFGAGRELADDASSDFAGTPLYLAPEVLQGQPVTVRSDIYSLGVLLYHLVTGSYPVHARTVREVRRAHERGERTAVRTARRDVSPKLARIIERTIDPNPARRYQSVEALGTDLLALKQRARILHVSARVEGGVRVSERRIRVTAKLADPANSAHLWAERYDRDTRDIFDLQEEIAQVICEKLKRPLMSAGQKGQKPKNIEAYNAHLKGRYHWNKRSTDDLLKAIACFQQAIAADPGYAPAYCGLADSYAVLGLHGMQSPKAIRVPATEAAKTAVRLDPTLAEAHTSLGMALTLYDWDWAAAEREFKRALELEPNSAIARYGYSRLLTCSGRVGDGLQQMRRALALDPLSLMSATALGWTLIAARRYDEAIHELQSVLDMDSAFVWAHIYLGWAYGHQGRLDAAVAAFEKACRSAGGSTTALGELGRAYALAGERTEALRILHQLRTLTRQRYVAPIDIGRVFDGLGEKEAALMYLENAADDRSVTLLLNKPRPFFATINSEPRFRRVLGRIGVASSDVSSRHRSVNARRETEAPAQGANSEGAREHRDRETAVRGLRTR
jgi:serine/threonine protein kinase/Flp pilus assembly protein TadD